MAEKDKGKQQQHVKAKNPKLEPCEKPHTMETSRPVDKEEACDEGVK
jgi:hypothetical protein